MSVEAMAIALHHSRARGTARLVLLGIANHDGDGGSWPSIDTLSIYAGGVDHRNVQRAIDSLEQLGEVRRLVQAGGTRSTADHRRPNLYEFKLQCPPDCDRTKHHRTRRMSKAPQLDVELRDGEWVVNMPDDGPEPSTGVALAPPVPLSTGVAVAPPHRVAVAPPEPTLGTEGTKEPDQPQTAREHAASVDFLAAHRCLDRTMRHEFSRRSPWCIYCGIHQQRPERRDPESKRIIRL